MKFKGTKEKWKLATNDYGYYTSVRNLGDTRKICVSRVNDMTESNANMLLISKAPEILDMLKILIHDYKNYTQNILQESHRINRIKKVEQLIKEATEL